MITAVVFAVVAVAIVVGLIVAFVTTTRARSRQLGLEEDAEGRVVEPEGRGGVNVEPEGRGGVIAPPAAEPPAAPSAAPPVEVPEAVRPALRDRLARSRRFLAGRVRDALGAGLDDDAWDDLEAALIQADTGVGTATAVVSEVRAEARAAGVTDVDGIRTLMAQRLLARFAADAPRALTIGPPPSVWLVVGVNGTGKTTTIGKIAADQAARGRRVVMAAADTFRAAADEQLEAWARRAGAELVKHRPGADPGAVAFDALAHARARGHDLLIVDTAGRLHTKVPLMDELAKIRRVVEKEGRVDEVLLVLDATAGQNGLAQARSFAAATGVTGVVLTKLDGTAKGGIAVAVEQELGIPIKLIGVGEGLGDLEPFEPRRFVEALLG